VTEVAATESPPLEEESSIFLADRSKGKNPGSFAKTLKPLPSNNFIDLKIASMSSQES
jgi:hypothetical protein